MASRENKPVKIGYRYGLILFSVGILMAAINVVTLHFKDEYYPKVFVTGLALTFLSLIFFIFPGGTVAQMPVGRELNKVFWKNAPALHRVMWIVWGILSIAAAFLVLIGMDPDFYK
jgi:hypothetical protein